MRPPGRSGQPARAGLLAGLLAALLAAAVALAPAASAHDELLSTTPADGSTVATAPAAVRLSFAAAPLGLGTVVRVEGPGGVVSTGAARIEGNDVVQPLAGQLRPGGYTVLWRVTSADGHPVSGSFGFRLAGTGASRATGAGTATGASGATGAATGSASPSGSLPTGAGGAATNPASTAAGSGGSGSGSGVLPVRYLAGMILVIAAAGAGLLLWRRR